MMTQWIKRSISTSLIISRWAGNGSQPLGNNNRSYARTFQIFWPHCMQVGDPESQSLRKKKSRGPFH